MKTKHKNEGLIGVVVFFITALLAIALSGCDTDGETAYARHVRKTRDISFSQCEAFCRSTPLEVRFDSDGHLTVCRCDVVIYGDDIEVH